MTRQPRVDGKTAIRVLRRAGFEVDYIEGSHHYLFKADLPGHVYVPVHGTETIKPKTFASILSQAGMSVDDFINLQRRRRPREKASPE